MALITKPDFSNIVDRDGIIYPDWRPRCDKHKLDDLN